MKLLTFNLVLVGSSIFLSRSTCRIDLGLVIPNATSSSMTVVQSVSSQEGITVNGTPDAPSWKLSDARNHVVSCFVTDEQLGKDNGLQNEFWYYCEDFFLNTHHFFWHMYANPAGKPIPDRLGELFYFQHHEFTIRYFNERWSAGLSLPNPLLFQAETLVPEGYNPNLPPEVVGTWRPSRLPNQYLQNAYAQRCMGHNFTVEAQIQIQRRFYEDVKKGYLMKNDGTKVPMNDLDGFDIVGQVLFLASTTLHSLQVNGYYQNEVSFHDSAHYLISAVMDPTGAKDLCVGVMAANALSLHDPAFYRLHGLLDEMFQAVKQLQDPYSARGSELALLWSGVRVLGVEVKETMNSEQRNQLHTLFAWKDFSINFGFDWKKTIGDPIPVCAKQQRHKPFNFNISYENHGPVTRATVRIFLAPRFNEYGQRIPIHSQYKMFFTLDRFTSILSPGKNEILRSSRDSSLTLPDDRWLKIQNNTYDERYCGCGLPNHLLLPKGTREGKVYDLFVMLTNGDEDAVAGSEVKPGACKNSPVWCPNYGVKYSDAKPMGYPFDRRPYETRAGKPGYLEEYVKAIGNMHAIQVTIRHLD